MVVRRGDIGIFGSDLVEGALPKVASKRQNIGLVHEREVLAVAAASELKGVTNATLYAMTSVDRTLRRYFEWCVLSQEATFTGIGSFGVLTDHDEIV